MSRAADIDAGRRVPDDRTARPRPKPVAVLRRWWWLPLLTAVAVAALAAVLARPGTTGYTAEATLIVPTVRPGESYPANIDNAVRLARVYASVLPQDPALLQGAAEQLGMPVEQVRAGLRATTAVDSPLLYVAFRAGTAETAVRAVTVVGDLAAAPPPGSSLVPGSLQVFQPASAAVRTATSTGYSAPIGVLLGLALGLLMLPFLERAAPRVDSPDDAGALVDGPISVLGRADPSTLRALAAQWRNALDGETGEPAICLLAAEPGRRRLVEGLGEQVREAVRVTAPAWNGRPSAVAAAGGRHLHVETSDPAPPARARRSKEPVVVVAGAPGTVEAGELVALAAEAVVLVVPAGARAARVERTLAHLQHSGVTPIWTLLVSRQGRLAG